MHSTHIIPLPLSLLTLCPVPHLLPLLSPLAPLASHASRVAYLLVVLLEHCLDGGARRLGHHAPHRAVAGAGQSGIQEAGADKGGGEQNTRTPEHQNTNSQSNQPHNTAGPDPSLPVTRPGHEPTTSGEGGGFAPSRVID
eukprot:1191572-Prorocentrum_minimum.AAC.2